jgi:hypothetical protein
MTKTQKDNLWRLVSLALVLFLFGYILVSRIGFHRYYKVLIEKQARIEQLVLENRKLIEEKH